MNDEQRCVILYRSAPSKSWSLCCIKEKISDAWRSARSTDNQEQILGSKSHKVIVCLETDFDKGKIKELRPPHDFDFNISIKREDKLVEIKGEEVKGEESVESKFKISKCEWCGNELSSGGAARFSHLKKHVRELVKNGVLSQEQANDVHSVKLTDEMRKLFEQHYKVLNA